MASSFESYNRRRLISSYFSVVLSIFLVLFLLGTLGLFVINSKKISNDFKENIPMTVFFDNDATDSTLKAFEMQLENAGAVKDYAFIHKDSAAKNNVDIVGKDFMEFLGFNPLENSFDIHLRGNFVNAKNISAIEKEFKRNPLISEIIYDKQLVELVNNNVKRISYWILIISGVLTIIAMLLINSSLRLSIYSHRFTIKTMQMVGATKSFIRKPFVMRSIKLGLLAAVLAVLAVVALAYYLDTIFPSLGITKDYVSMGIVVSGILIFGIFITGISTFFATQRFLNLKTDALY